MADVTICGAGIFGLSIAWEMLNRGATVTVIDPGGPGSASRGLVGALQPHTPDPWNEKKQFQLESLLAAETFWREVDGTSGINSGYVRAGRLQPLTSEREVALALDRIEAAKANWGTAAVWEVIEEVGDWAPPSPTGLYLRDSLSALLHPLHATVSLTVALASRGVQFVDAQIKAPVIWATGWRGLLDLNAAFGQNVGTGVKGQALVLGHAAAGNPQVFVDGLHVIPHFDGTVAIGSTTEREFNDPEATDERLDELHARAITQMPILKGAPVYARWAGVRPRAASRAPLLGPWPGRPGHFIANGGFKIGFGVAPKCATLMAELVLEGKDAIPRPFHTDLLKAKAL